jgi:hypothetical protein
MPKALLGASEQEVREHAQTALAVLASRESPVVAAEVREHLGDYLLGQRGCPAEYLELDAGTAEGAQALAWGRAVNEGLAELLGLAPHELHSLTCDEAPNPSAVPSDDGPPAETLSPPATPAGVRGRLGSLRVTALAVTAAGIVIGICAAWVIGPPGGHGTSAPHEQPAPLRAFGLSTFRTRAAMEHRSAISSECIRLT